ncbi:hypothetical protein D3C76_1367950 [compost metagenome]
MHPGGGEAVTGPLGGQCRTLAAAGQIGTGQDQRLHPGGAGAGHQCWLFAGKLGAGEVETNVDHGIRGSEQKECISGI